MKYHIVTYGCQMNHSDSERIASVLSLAGIAPAKDMNNADLLIINSCSVRQSAINRIHGQLRNFQRRPGLHQTILTGCVLEADKKKFKDKFDLIIDIQELAKNPDKLIKSLGVEGQEFKAFDYTDYFKINPQYRSNFSAYVPIMTGCNNFCSYCAVPYTRGREISRTAEEIILEVKRLIGKGYKEITLLGQNVNSYRSSGKNSSSVALPRPTEASGERGAKEDKLINFSQLLKLINDIPGDFWIKFLTSHPKDMSDELIKTMVKCEKVCEYIHLPVQAGDDEILRKMNRHYTAKHYMELVNKIRAEYQLKAEPPEAGKKHYYGPLAISTDIIVGFPSETKTQFNNTAKIMRKVKYDMAYLAEYSPRPGTAAAKLKDDVPILEKKRRKEFLNDILRKTALANNKKYVGKVVEILIEKIEGGIATGKTRTFKNIKMSYLETGFPSALGNPVSKFMPGHFAKVKIIKADPWGLEGEIVE